MSVGKSVVLFFVVALFAVTMVAMAATMASDMPDDSYYDNANNSAAGSTELAETSLGVGTNLMVPAVAVAGILALMAGMLILRRK